MGASGIRGGSEPQLVDRLNLPQTIILGEVEIGLLMGYGGDVRYVTELSRSEVWMKGIHDNETGNRVVSETLVLLNRGVSRKFKEMGTRSIPHGRHHS